MCYTEAIAEGHCTNQKGNGKMKIELTEKQTVKLLLLVRHYINDVLKSSRLPVRHESIDFYEKLYDDLGRQIPEAYDPGMWGVKDV